MANKHLKYEVRVVTKWKNIKSEEKDMFGGNIVIPTPVEYGWMPLESEVYNDELYQTCLEEVKKGNCRNVEVVN